MSVFWESDCHETFEQRCSIYFIRLKQPFCVTINKIEELIYASFLPSYRINSIYGTEDFVVVARGHKDMHSHFVKLIENSNFIGSVRRYECEQKIPKLDADILSFRLTTPMDTKLVEDFYAMPEVNRASLQSVLISSKMLIRVPFENGYRFFSEFTLPQRTSNTSVRMTGQSQIESAFSSLAQQSAFHVSVYLPRDDRTQKIFVECLCPDFTSYFDALRERASAWASEKIECVTYVAASTETRTRDEILTSFNGISQRAKRLIDFLENSYVFRPFVELGESEQNLLIELFSRFSKPQDTHYAEPLRDLLLSRLLKDREYLIRALTILVKIEGYFSLMVKNVWIETYKDTWFEKIRDAIASIRFKRTPFSQLEEQQKKQINPNSMTLKECIAVSNSLPEVSTKLDSLLGNNWFKPLNSVTEDLRNDFAHGRSVTDDDALGDAWKQTAKQLCDVFQLYEGIRDYFENKIRLKQSVNDPHRTSHESPT